MANDLLDFQQSTRTHTHGSQPKSNKQHREKRVPAHLTAQIDRHVSRQCRIDGHFDQTQDRGITCTVEFSNVLVSSIHRQGVLRQIIGPDTDKADFG